MLVGQVGQDRDVVGDLVDPVEGEAVRRRLDDRGPVAGADHRPECRWSAGASGVVACASLAAWTPPIRVAAVPIIPVRRPAASSAATARNEVVVLPSVPVIPTTARSRLGSPYHHAAARGQRGAACRRRRAAAGRRPATGRSTSAAAARPRRPPRRSRGRRRGARGRPRTASRRRTVARIVGDAADGDVGQAGRPDRPAVAPRAARRRRSAASRSISPPSGAGPVGSAAARKLGEGRLGHRRTSRVTPAGEPPGPVAARVVDPLVGAGQLEPAPAERRACAGRGRTAGRPRAARRGRPATSTPPRSISEQPSRIASWIARQRSRWRAPGWSAPARRRGRPSGRSTAARRGGTGRARRAARRRRVPARASR